MTPVTVGVVWAVGVAVAVVVGATGMAVAGGEVGVAVPVVAMILSTLFEGYQWSLLAGVGAVLAMAGLLVALSGRK